MMHCCSHRHQLHTLPKRDTKANSVTAHAFTENPFQTPDESETPKNEQLDNACSILISEPDILFDTEIFSHMCRPAQEK
jgi:hypothetical protein